MHTKNVNQQKINVQWRSHQRVFCVCVWGGIVWAWALIWSSIGDSLPGLGSWLCCLPSNLPQCGALFGFVKGSQLRHPHTTRNASFRRMGTPAGAGEGGGSRH